MVQLEARAEAGVRENKHQGRLKK